MNGIEAISPIGSSGLGLNSVDPVLTKLGMAMPAAPMQTAGVNFSDMMNAGMRHVDAKIGNANELVKQFTLDDSVPLHQVTYALEEARMTVELAMQVRGRLVESFREMMNMQL